MIKDLKEHLISILNSSEGRQILDSSNSISSNYYPSVYSTITDDYCRLWKLDPLVTLPEALKYIKEICNKTTSYDYRIAFKGSFIEKNNASIFEESNIAEEDHVVIELREMSKGWHFMSDDVPNVDKCEFCSKYEILKHPCGCKKVFHQ